MQRFIAWAETHREHWLDCIRIYLGLGLLARGLLLITNTSPGYIVDFFQRAGQSWLGTGFLMHYVMIAHFVGGLLLTIGFLTRLAALVQIPILVGAVFVVVADNQERWMYPAGFVAFGLVAAALVAGCAADHGPLVRVLSWRPLRWIGRVSYGIYLWSWPTQAFAEAHWRLHGWRLDLTVVAATLAFAAVSAQVVEKPFRTGRLFAARPPARL